MKDNIPHVTASGMPRSARAIESNTATMSPNTVVTSRYCRVPQAKGPSASAILGRSAAIEATRSPAPPVSTLRNSSSASRNTKLDASPATLPNSAPITPANLPRFSELAACWSCSGPTPSSASLAVAEFTRPSAFDAYWGSSVPRRASEKMIPRASESLVYLIARGRSMNERALARAQHSQEAFGQYVRETAGASTTSTADELSKLADLRDRGTISDEEFQHAKAKLLGRQPETVPPTYTDGRPVPSTR